MSGQPYVYSSWNVRLMNTIPGHALNPQGGSTSTVDLNHASVWLRTCRNSSGSQHKHELAALHSLGTIKAEFLSRRVCKGKDKAQRNGGDFRRFKYASSFPWDDYKNTWVNDQHFSTTSSKSFVLNQSMVKRFRKRHLVPNMPNRVNGPLQCN